MQIDSTAGGAGAASSTGGGTGAGGAASTNPSEAGPSGVQPGASYDAQMAEPPQRRPARKHSDAPMRKLSVSLIDTYKLINQVGAFSKLHGQPLERKRHRGRRRAAGRGSGRGRCRRVHAC